MGEGRRSLTKRLQQQDLARRSPLYRWLYEHFEELEEHLRRSQSWQTVASVANESGLGVSRQSVHATWKRVQRDKKRAADRPPARIFPSEQTMPLENPETGDDEFQITDISGRPIKP